MKFNRNPLDSFDDINERTFLPITRSVYAICAYNLLKQNINI